MLRQRSLRRWPVVVICFLGYNMTVGFALGSFGPLLVSTEQDFGVSRSAATMGMAFMNLAIGGLGPLLGTLMQRIPVSHAMAAGGLLSAAGYLGLATLNYYPLALLMFVLIGAGISLSGVIGPLTVISRWYADGRGRALSIVNLPIAVLVTPFVVSAALPYAGRSAILGTAAIIFIALIPLFLLLRDPAPAEVGTSGEAAAKGPPAMSNAARTDTALESRQIFAMRSFWFLSLAMGIMSGTGSVFYAHMVPFGTSQAMSLTAAAGLLSANAAAGMFGVLLFGRIADWLGPPQTLVLASFLQMLLWLVLLVAPVEGLYLASALMGICAMPMLTLHGAALSALIPPHSVSRGMGLSYAIKLPFLFVLPLAAAFLFEATNGYLVPFTAVAGLMGVCCMLLVALVMATRQHSPSKLAVG